MAVTMKNTSAKQEYVERRALSIVEAEKAMGLSRASVYRAIGSGALSTVKVGGRRLVPVASIDSLLQAGAA
jgi:excisionase family DNA binding protein